MPKPYDATTKFLVEGFPADWLAFAGCGPLGRVDVIDANLSTITAEADKVLRVDGPEPWLAHVELQTSHEASLPRRLLRYNTLLECVTKLWVEMNERSESVVPAPMQVGLHRWGVAVGGCYPMVK